MKKLVISLFIFYTLNVYAENYLISFAVTGAATTVSTVKVENLTSGLSLTLNGGDILNLTFTTDIYPVGSNQSTELKIYPNPMTDESIIQFLSPEEGVAVFNVHDMNGKRIAQIPCYLEQELQEFNLSGLFRGIYLISIKGRTFQYSGKVFCLGNRDGRILITKINNNQKVEQNVFDIKGIQVTTDMAYTIGDRLKFTGISGNYSTVMTDIPTQSKTITFNFIPCTDVDNNNYPVIAIGSQVWMAENLKTTKFNDGIAIPLVTENLEWGGMATPGYCWYNNDQNKKDKYGALYNFYTVNNGVLCPTGWHAPTDTEWTTLTTYLGGESVAGSKLKSCIYPDWAAPNSDATNETGFTALGCGLRGSEGSFSGISTNGRWWSYTEGSSASAWYRSMFYTSTSVGRGLGNKRFGFSVRCIKD